jgi:hypothetical protein
MVKVGQVATTHEVKARWAFAEMKSIRFGDAYPNSDLKQKAVDGVPFCELTLDEHNELVTQLHTHARGDFSHSVDGCLEYICEGWSKSQLLQAWALPAFHPQGQNQCIPYSVFHTSPSLTDSSGNPQPSDPRSQPLAAEAFGASEPGIVVDLPLNHPLLPTGGSVLLEGYGRSRHFMNDPSAERFLVWRPRG